MKLKTIVFVHGMFMTPLCWEHWVDYFQAQGYACIAPAWPGRSVPVAELRKTHPDPLLGKLTLSAVIEHLAAIVSKIDDPILIGHSMGGLVVQLLLQRNLASAGVAIDSAPPAGIISAKWSFLKSNWPMINPFVSRYAPREMSFADFEYAFVNGLPLDEQRAAYDRYAVPESRMIPRESLGKTAKIDFTRLHAPLLLTAGSNDHIVPASLNRTNYLRYRASPSITEFKEFPGRVHFTIGQKGWEETADYIASWLKEKVK